MPAMTASFDYIHTQPVATGNTVKPGAVTFRIRLMSSGVGQTMPSAEGLQTLTKDFARNRCSLLTSFCWERLSGRWLCAQWGLLVCVLLWGLFGGSFVSWSVWCLFGCAAATLHGRLFSQLLRAFD